MSVIYNVFKDRSAEGNAPWSTSTARTYQLMLISSTTHTENADLALVDDGSTTDVASAESTSTTYSRQTMGTLSVTQDDTNDRAVLDAADVTFTSINTGQVDACVVIEVPTASTSDTARYPVCYNDSTSAFPVTTNGGDLTIQWSTAGVMTLT